MKCIIKERKQIIPEVETKDQTKNQMGEGEEVEGKVFGEVKRQFLLREIGEK